MITKTESRHEKRKEVVVKLKPSKRESWKRRRTT